MRVAGVTAAGATAAVVRVAAIAPCDGEMAVGVSR